MLKDSELGERLDLFPEKKLELVLNIMGHIILFKGFNFNLIVCVFCLSVCMLMCVCVGGGRKQPGRSIKGISLESGDTVV